MSSNSSINYSSETCDGYDASTHCRVFSANTNVDNSFICRVVTLYIYEDYVTIVMECQFNDDSDDYILSLWSLYVTTPAEMTGVALLKQHDNLHRQITAFEKLLQKAIHRFSKEKLYQMLKNLMRGLSYNCTSGDMVHSITHLKKLVQELDATVGKIGQHNDKFVMEYFATFFEDIEYLKELKHYFDKKIYICLYEYFYDPLDDIQESELRMLLNRCHHEKVLQDSISGVHGDTDIIIEDIVADSMSSKCKLSQAVWKMSKVNKNWDDIMTESVPNMGSYNPGNQYEIIGFTDHMKYETVLRLMPDIFLKAKQSVELAKLWWTHANKVYHAKPMTRRTMKDFYIEECQLKKKIGQAVEDIQLYKEAMKSHKLELECLNKREQRFQILSEQCEQLEKRKDYVSQSCHTLVTNIDSMKKELDVLEKGTKRHMGIKKKLEESDKKLMVTEDKLKLSVFHFNIVQEDFNLQMKLRPHFIRFRADVECKITDFRQDIQDKISEQKKLEKMLRLLKTNYDRMKQIMDKVNSTNNKDIQNPMQCQMDKAELGKNNH